jgi:Fur family transcriptional regulator, ferric uptake regulator
VVDSSPFLVALDRAGYRLTDARRAVAQLIADQVGHFSAADLVGEARARRLGIGRATIFRTLDLLSELDVVARVDLPSGEHAYIGCAGSHHHHVICARCGRTADIEDAGLKTLVREVARQTGYRVDAHRLEMFGLCADCQADAPIPISRTA